MPFTACGCLLTPWLHRLHQKAVAQGQRIFGERVEEPRVCLDLIDRQALRWVLQSSTMQTQTRVRPSQVNPLSTGSLGSRHISYLLCKLTYGAFSIMVLVASVHLPGPPPLAPLQVVLPLPKGGPARTGCPLTLTLPLPQGGPARTGCPLTLTLPLPKGGSTHTGCPLTLTLPRPLPSPIR